MLVRESVAEEAAAPRAMGLDCTIVLHAVSQCEIANCYYGFCSLQNLHGEACGRVLCKDLSTCMDA